MFENVLRNLCTSSLTCLGGSTVCFLAKTENNSVIAASFRALIRFAFVFLLCETPEQSPVSCLFKFPSCLSLLRAGWLWGSGVGCLSPKPLNLVAGRRPSSTASGNDVNLLFVSAAKAPYLPLSAGTSARLANEWAVCLRPAAAAGPSMLCGWGMGSRT